MNNSPFIAKYALRHKRDFILYPSPDNSVMTFPDYDKALEFRSTLFNAHQWRVVKHDSSRNEFV